jgi:hypothetical protein
MFFSLYVRSSLAKSPRNRRLASCTVVQLQRGRLFDSRPQSEEKQMRHSDARITLGIYGHVVGDAQRRAVENHAENIEKYAVQ